MRGRGRPTGEKKRDGLILTKDMIVTTIFCHSQIPVGKSKQKEIILCHDVKISNHMKL